MGRGLACNSYFAQAIIDGNSIRIGKAGATMMACAPLGKAAAYRIDGDGKLFLVDADGVDIVRFASVG